MKARPTKRRLRSKNGKREPRLSEQDILEAALRLIRARGVDALGMRGLAEELGVSPMAIYYHVPNKQELLHRVAETVAGQLPTPTPRAEDWEQQLRDYALAVMHLWSPYPGLSRVVLERPPLVAARRITLYLFSLLQTAGFDDRGAVSALMSVQTYLAGTLSIQARVERPRKRSQALRRHPLASEDRTLEQQFMQVKPREWMEAGVETMIAGLRARLPARRPARVDMVKTASEG